MREGRGLKRRGREGSVREGNVKRSEERKWV